MMCRALNSVVLKRESITESFCMFAHRRLGIVREWSCELRSRLSQFIVCLSLYVRGFELAEYAWLCKGTLKLAMRCTRWKSKHLVFGVRSTDLEWIGVNRGKSMISVLISKPPHYTLRRRMQCDILFVPKVMFLISLSVSLSSSFRRPRESFSRYFKIMSAIQTLNLPPPATAQFDVQDSHISHVPCRPRTWVDHVAPARGWISLAI